MACLLSCVPYTFDPHLQADGGEVASICYHKSMGNSYSRKERTQQHARYADGNRWNIDGSVADISASLIHLMLFIRSAMSQLLHQNTAEEQAAERDRPCCR